jgi:hypothetical protein
MKFNLRKQIARLLNITPEILQQPLPETIEKELLFIYTDFQKQRSNLAKKALTVLAFVGIIMTIIFTFEIPTTEAQLALGVWFVAVFVLSVTTTRIFKKLKNIRPSHDYPENIYCPHFISSIKQAEEFLALLHKAKGLAFNPANIPTPATYHLIEKILYLSRTIHQRTTNYNNLLIMLTVMFFVVLFALLIKLYR